MKQVNIDRFRFSVNLLVRAFKLDDSATFLDGGVKLHPPDLQALLFIREHPECITSDVGGFLGVVPTTTSALIDRLVKQDLVMRKRTDRNRRVVQLVLTDRGGIVVSEIIARQNRNCSAILELLDVGERKAFVDAVEKIASGMRA